MTRHVILKSPSEESPTMRNLSSPPTSLSKERRKVGEVAGGAAAECAAVWCCCPCAVVNLMVLAVYKVPAAVCKKAWRRSKRRRFTRKRHGLLASATAEGSESTVHARLKEDDLTAEIVFEECHVSGGDLNDVVRLENEMLERFYGAGFWRSPSQRDTSSGSF
ncbi:hypothetical protein CARUB_v10024215mg [Capsella rubella]|uniref:Uncharacterized protein n=1 Tax=Capsella rubella TaxID=81985 RepID=R0FYF0_9BRAS|nr:uncharacterized protein LOC17888965 [Capsella rubella]EOA28042.1 hypothetical protein CARUB_v10024215mg [Capsella rubella]